jgi:hypothetical protein
MAIGHLLSYSPEWKVDKIRKDGPWGKEGREKKL